jgi:UDP-glucuronate 4-epimerase
MKKVFFITGSAGFIGMHLSLSLLKRKFKVVGIDNINNYYDKSLKIDRINKLSKFKKFIFYKIDINKLDSLKKIYKKNKCNIIIHLAAQPGVRFSFIKPKVYLKNNVDYFLNILELAKIFNPKKFIYASSSSVYGGNTKLPFAEKDKTDEPLSLYAATKKMNELMSFVFHKAYKIETIGLRFFTVYGPYGRPDMSYFKFVKNILLKKKINIFNNGNMLRDFTYIDDVIDRITKIIFLKKKIGYKVINLGNNKPLKLKKFIQTIEEKLKTKALRNNLKMQVGEVKNTISSNTQLKKIIKIKKFTPLKIGLSKFIDWYKSKYSVDFF